ncbi:MAG: hypothetical protein AAF385_14250 [Pseudomonadota bacterium]
MKTVIADKIASVAQHNDLSREIRLSTDIPAEEGVLVACEILNNKSRYNVLELTSGRMAAVNRGDVIVGALGFRNALFGYSGKLPQSVKVGDVIQMLNIGGVLGDCDSINPELGEPFDCKVLGGVLSFPYLGERIGVPARVGAYKFNESDALDTHGVPVIAMAGTSMDSGKTAAASAIVSRLRQMGLRIAGGKTTGVSLRRDILAMEDAGASNALLFSDFGVVTTSAKNGPALTRAILSKLTADKPDVVILELGDGLLGSYGVDGILNDPAIRKAISAVVLCASDPVGAWGGVQLLRERFKLEPAVVTGPATDNKVGIDIVTQQMKVSAINAMTHGSELADLLADKLKLQKSSH